MLNAPSAVVADAGAASATLAPPRVADSPPRVTLTTETGTEFLLTADLSHQGACIAILPGPTGLDAPPWQATVTEYAGMDGGRLVKTRAAARRINLPLLIWAPTRPELLALKRQLVAAVIGGGCWLRVAEADGTARSIRVHYTGGLEGDEGADAAGLAYTRYGLQLTAPDPYWYGPERTETFRVHGAPRFLSHPAGSWTTVRSDTMTDPAAWTMTSGTPLTVAAEATATDGSHAVLPGGDRAETTAAFPYDGTSLYRITVRARAHPGPDGGPTPLLSAGLNGSAIGRPRMLAAARRPLPGGDWVELTGYAQGWAAPRPDDEDEAEAPAEADPATLPTGTTAVRPVLQADGAPVDVDHVTLSRLTPGSTTGTGEPHAMGFLPLRIAPSVIGDTGLPVDVSTDVDAWPVWRITGPLGRQDTGQPTVPIRLANLTTGGELLLDYGIPPGRTVVIDTRPGIKAVYLETSGGGRGENLWPRVEGPAALWPLIPGENRIAVTASGATDRSAVALTYQPRHLGA
ncbi:hypothetical protein [Streptomyces luteireticuli]|uniref:Phage tail protein n=1 Tax=Streptomyces luteireticuli TaxID=173858 RepID=A0ABN0Z034_9ACTN